MIGRGEYTGELAAFVVPGKRALRSALRTDSTASGAGELIESLGGGKPRELAEQPARPKHRAAAT
jgi:hypothetical protein